MQKDNNEPKESNQSITEEIDQDVYNVEENKEKEDLDKDNNMPVSSDKPTENTKYEDKDSDSFQEISKGSKEVIESIEKTIKPKEDSFDEIEKESNDVVNKLETSMKIPGWLSKSLVMK